MRRKRRIAKHAGLVRILSLVLCTALCLSALPAHTLSVGESSRLCNHVCGDGMCGRSAGEAETPCDHVCRVAGFDGYTPGSPLITYAAPDGAAYADILAALPTALPGRLVCIEGARDIPVTWSCDTFAAESGVYEFRAALADRYCDYAVPDDPATADIDESTDSPYCDLPCAAVTVASPAAPVEPPIIPVRGHVCEITDFTDYDPGAVLAIAQFDKGRTVEELFAEVLPQSLAVSYACPCASSVVVLPGEAHDAQADKSDGIAPVVTTASLPVTWECADFDPNRTGDYIFTVKALPDYPFRYLKQDDPATIEVIENLLPSILVRVYEPTAPTDGFTVCYGVLNSDGVHVRSGPGTIFKSLARFDTDTPVTVTGQCDHWYRVDIARWTGAFIDKSLITVLEEQSGAAPPMTGKLNADEVKIRKGPDRSYDVITVLPVNAPMTILGRCGNWYFIFTEDVEQGYVWREYVTIDPPVPIEGPTCACTERCAEGHTNVDCPVCADHPDECAIRYVAEGYPRTGRVNTENCEVRVGAATLHLHLDAALTLYNEAEGLFEFSSDEITKGYIATGFVTIIEYECTCTAPCTQATCNQLCPVCAAEGWGACASKELSEQVISAVAEDGSTITISGSLPVGATASVAVVPLETAAEFVAEGAQILFAYDIKILVAGVEWQPDEHVRVSITPPPETPIVSDVAVTHVAEDKDTGAVTASAITDVSTTLSDEAAAQPGAVEFAAEGFSVYVITLGTTTPRVTFSYDAASLTVTYCTTIDGTYETLGGDVSVTTGTTLYFKVTNGTVNSVIRDGTATMTPNGSDVYTVDNVTVNTTIVIGSNISLDVSNGPIVIGGANGSNRVYTYSDVNGLQTGSHLSSNIYSITGSSGDTENGGGYNVTLTGAGDFNVVLNGVNIYTGQKGVAYIGEGICAPVSTSGVTGDGNINITLVRENTLKNVSSSPVNSFAALEKNNTPSTLIIGGVGTLNATGGADSAGIGGSNNLNDGNSGGTKNIIINSGTIFATSMASEGAGIGSGDNKPANNIKIYGGYITATGVGNGAGIGGSGSANFVACLGEVYIYGGTITAISNGAGAGIGGGGSGSENAALGGDGTIHIYGGNITASSIGGGHGGGGSGGTATITISGGKVTVNESGNIGGGSSASGTGGTATVNITGGTVVTPRISGGHNGSNGTYNDAAVSIAAASVNIGDRSNINSVTGPDPANGMPTVVYSQTIDISHLSGYSGNYANVAIQSAVLTDGYTYPLKDVYSDSDGKVYFWLPPSCDVTSLTIAGTIYPVKGAQVLTATITHDSSTVGTVLGAVLNHGTPTSYEWQRSTDNGTNWVPISSATSISYTVVRDDVGKLIRVRISTADGPTITSGSLRITDTPFANIRYGSLEAPCTLTAQLLNGSGGSYTYAWQVFNTELGSYEDIDGAASATFTANYSYIGKHIRVVISDGDTPYTTSFVVVRPPQLTVTVPISMAVTVDGAGTCTAAGGSITNSTAVPVYVTNVSYAWVTAGNPDADEVFHDYTRVNAELSLGGTTHDFIGETPTAATPNALIAAKNGDTAGSLPLGWGFTLGPGNYINLVSAIGGGVHVATVTYTIDYNPLTTP